MVVSHIACASSAARTRAICSNRSIITRFTGPLASSNASKRPIMAAAAMTSSAFFSKAGRYASSLAIGSQVAECTRRGQKSPSRSMPAISRGSPHSLDGLRRTTSITAKAIFRERTFPSIDSVLQPSMVGAGRAGVTCIPLTPPQVAPARALARMA